MACRVKMAVFPGICSDPGAPAGPSRADLGHEDHLDAYCVIGSARPRVPSRDSYPVFLGGQRYQHVIDSAASDAQAAQRAVYLPRAAAALSTNGAANRASSRRAASSACHAGGIVSQCHRRPADHEHIRDDATPDQALA